MIDITTLGETSEIGGSCFHLNINGTGILLDCGMHPKKSGMEALPDFELLENLPVDYCIISHAHHDHIGALPYLVQKHPYVKILMTPQTCQIAELTLRRSLSILREQLSEDDPLKPYSSEEIDLLLRSAITLKYEEPLQCNGYHHSDNNPVYVTLYDAGHILGSAGILIEYNEKTIFYTGDISLQQQKLLPPASLPPFDIDVLLLETTHGATPGTELPDWDEEAERLAKKINKVLAKGGGILVPVFAVGKTQEILATIWELMQKGKIPSTEIYLGGLGIKVSKLYDKNRYLVNRVDKNFELMSIPKMDLYDVTNVSTLANKPCIILTTSGMMVEKTFSYKMGLHWLTQSQAAILSVGYMDPDSPGYKFMNAEKNEKIIIHEDASERTVHCDIEKFRFSSHAKREDLLTIVDTLNVKYVYLIHGDDEASNWMGNEILKNNNGVRVGVAEKGKLVNLA